MLQQRTRFQPLSKHSFEPIRCGLLSQGAGMRRREFLGALGGAAAWPVVARAQQPALPVIGFLSGRSSADSIEEVKGFHRGLAEAGYTVGQNIVAEFRWADGRYDRLPALATELVARRVAVIAAVGGGASGLAAKSVTSTIPIIFASGGDAVKIGLVASLNQPGGNVTGVNIIFGALGAKRLELLHELVPATTAVAMLVNPNYPSAPIEVQDVEAAGRKLGLNIHVFNARTEGEIEPAFSSLAQQKAGGLLVADDPFLQSQRDRLVRLAERHAVPAIYFSPDFVDAGGLMSYGPNLVDVYRLVGVYCGRILKGEKPADLPVQQPTKYSLIINLKTARTLGLTISREFLLRADDVIE
jgi:putative tryptophan/tyrosine transport system substrate-binding protein